jgi:hypothetical protein
MLAHVGLRQVEDEPSPAHVREGKAEHVAEQLGAYLE